MLVDMATPKPTKHGSDIMEKVVTKRPLTFKEKIMNTQNSLNNMKSPDARKKVFVDKDDSMNDDHDKASENIAASSSNSYSSSSKKVDNNKEAGGNVEKRESLTRMQFGNLGFISFGDGEVADNYGDNNHNMSDVESFSGEQDIIQDVMQSPTCISTQLQQQENEQTPTVRGKTGTAAERTEIARDEVEETVVVQTKKKRRKQIEARIEKAANVSENKVAVKSKRAHYQIQCTNLQDCFCFEIECLFLFSTLSTKYYTLQLQTFF